MVFTLFRFILFACFVHLNRALGNPGDNVLNLSDDPKGRLLYRRNETQGAFSFGTYIPDISNIVTKVMDGDSTIWEGRPFMDLLYMFRVYKLYCIPKVAYAFVLTPEGSITRYYEKNKYEWNEITESVFNRKLSMIKRIRRFDLKWNNDDGTFFVQDHKFYGIGATVFIPYPMYEVNIVYDDFDVIWQRMLPFEKCTCIIVHGDLNSSQLVHLHILIGKNRNEKFMRKIDGDWYEVTKTEFYSVLDELDNEAENKRESEEQQIPEQEE